MLALPESLPKHALSKGVPSAWGLIGWALIFWALIGCGCAATSAPLQPTYRSPAHPTAAGHLATTDELDLVRALAASALEEEGPSSEDLGDLLFEVIASPRDGADDDLWGLGLYNYADAGWGVGLQLQGTLRGTDPELEVVLTPPSAELQGRTTAVVVDVVVTYRLLPSLGLFAGVGYASLEEFRRFEDAIGNDFFVSQDEDVRANLTAGAHLWLTDWLTASVQWDSAFEAAAFGLGLYF
jgi:hypothetical protein